MKKFLLLSAGLVGTVMLSACNAAPNANANANVSDETSSASSMTSMAPADTDHDAVSSVDADNHQDDGVPAAGTVSSADNQATNAAAPMVVNVNVTSWAFTPNVITAKKGQLLTVHLVGVSGSHSFGSKDLGINVPINEGETKDVVIPTDRAGTFEFRCMMPCGQGHRDMTGQIIITE
jgi:cytochrome c oxidase subunit 2